MLCCLATAIINYGSGYEAIKARLLCALERSPLLLVNGFSAHLHLVWIELTFRDRLYY